MKNYLTFSLGLMLTIMVDAGAFSQVADTTAINSMWFNEGGYVRGITSARLIGLLELSLGLASLVMAIRAKKNSAIVRAKIALIIGLITTAFCIVHLFITAGAIFGSGRGKAGSILAMILSLVGITLASQTLRPSKN